MSILELLICSSDHGLGLRILGAMTPLSTMTTTPRCPPDLHPAANVRIPYALLTQVTVLSLTVRILVKEKYGQNLKFGDLVSYPLSP